MPPMTPDSVLLQMMDSSEFSDLVFVCQREEFKVHKAVVCAQSQWMLLAHCRVNAIGDYYQIEELVLKANDKAKCLLQNDALKSTWLPAIPLAIEEVLASTCNDELIDMLASAAGTNIATLLGLEEFRSVSAFSKFSFKVLQACSDAMVHAVEENGLKSRSEIDQKTRQLLRKGEEVERLVGCVTILKNHKRCSNDAYHGRFDCDIGLTGKFVTCTKCRRRHFE